MGRLFFLLLSWTTANALEPSGWERKSLIGTPVSLLVPKGSTPQRTARHPGFDEATTGWMFQSHHWPDRGDERIIRYLKPGGITASNSRDTPYSTSRTLTD